VGAVKFNPEWGITPYYEAQPEKVGVIKSLFLDMLAKT
jgi:hypothetical protein